MMKMIMKKLAFFAIILCISVSKGSANEGFFTTRNTLGVSIDIPTELSPVKPKEENNNFLKSTMFTNSEKTKMIILTIEPLEMESMTLHQWFEKIYFPGINPGGLLLNNRWKLKYSDVEYMEKVEFNKHFVYVTKGETKSSQKVYACDLFNVENDWKLGIMIASKDGFFLSDEQVNEILESVKKLE